MTLSSARRIWQSVGNQVGSGHTLVVGLELTFRSLLLGSCSLFASSAAPIPSIGIRAIVLQCNYGFKSMLPHAKISRIDYVWMSMHICICVTNLVLQALKLNPSVITKYFLM